MTEYTLPGSHRAIDTGGESASDTPPALRMCGCGRGGGLQAAQCCSGKGSGDLKVSRPLVQLGLGWQTSGENWKKDGQTEGPSVRSARVWTACWAFTAVSEH